MKKWVIISTISVGVIFLALLGSTNKQTQPLDVNTTQPTTSNSTKVETAKKLAPVCDGKTVTTDCTLDGATYATYIYHPPIEEKSHTETVTTYKQEVASYCTLCNDNTYSPTCATGRGACSHHGGVAQWNAPVYSDVPEYTAKNVIDAPAQDAFYEKLLSKLQPSQ